MTESMHASWQVTSQQERAEVNPAGQLTDGYRVSFVTGEGHAGTVFVPALKYNVDSVRAMVQDAADRLDAIGSLTSES